MKIDKAERILENFKDDRACPVNVKAAIETVLNDNTHQFHSLNFARSYLNGMTTLGEADVTILREGIH